MKKLTGLCLFLSGIAATLLARPVAEFFSGQYLPISFEEGTILISINGKDVHERTPVLFSARTGRNVLIFQKDGKEYSYVFNLVPGGDIYMSASNEDLKPIPTVRTTENDPPQPPERSHPTK